MKIPLTVLAVTAASLALFLWLGPRPEPGLKQPRSDLPWQVTALSDGTSSVFDLHLGEATLEDAAKKFGPYENMAVFVANNGEKALEVYFGAVQFGPLKANIVATLEATDPELDDLVASARDREGSPSGDWKFILTRAANQAQRRRKVRSITYIPGYSGLEADFFRERLGEPAAWRTINEHTVQWFYPEKGVSLLLNSDGKEVLEYSIPRTFTVPADAER